ncbi:SGS-domain-containing protein [Metschnikowia bicuspidata var. bicuspidata NRRL YB-4993]|uniref:SGS-domain-containing protein n=1 Tax=Metschnikowia bicuspidata var. bicuspidata NRRL YB-4993 TaxID=869754 RepID=A0A1A0HI79_9ASCO|nr:SGS-domain-containing protein [Metschnikowia bicuspidata var. bicuspidata NRRL YB-4993]OBA23874.1 SGS-domain-containing protein [Metschnikowia bicuspidata var. bicuspidata NRRL YB-4993]
MAIEQLIKQGDQASEKKDFLTAISKFSEALKENPQAFTALIKRAQVYTKLSDYDSAKADISKAFTAAEQRGKMSDKATCYFRLGLVCYAKKDFEASLLNLRKARDFKCTEAALDIWIAKAERDAKKSAGSKNEGDLTSEKEKHKKISNPEKDERVPTQNAASSSIDTINKQAPIKAKIRDEWYQSKDSVTITIFAKDVPKDSVQVEFGTRSLAVAFPTSEASEYSYTLDSLYSEIVPERSSYVVGSKKMEISLRKKNEGKWAALEGDGPISIVPPSASGPKTGGLSYPTSSRKKVDWSNFDVKEEDDESGDFFAKLYKDVDEDTKRAMMKSYVESNGTVLTTNWAEAKEKTFETSPPDGMEAKKWGT